MNDEFGLTAVATIALWTDGFTMAEMRDAARNIADRLYELDGIRRVDLYGLQDEVVYLRYSNTKLAESESGRSAENRAPRKPERISTPLDRRCASASGVVGPLAASARTRVRIFFMLPRWIWFSSAAGTRTSQSLSKSSALLSSRA